MPKEASIIREIGVFLRPMSTYESIKKSSLDLAERLSNLDIAILGLSSLGHSYYEYNRTRMRFTSENNARILFHIIEKSKVPLGKQTIIDHGGGLGYFALLCKSIGIQTVIYHDINLALTEDTKIISKHLNIPIDHYITGSTEALTEYCLTQPLSITGLGSRNVIEHIPDLNEFFKLLALISGKDKVFYFSTSANTHNPLVRWQHRKIHRQYEREGAYTDMSKDEINPENSGHYMRRTILLENGFPADHLGKMIELTRGLDLSQILNTIASFKSTGALPSKHTDPTNTRDPYSGNWVERLLPFEEYKKAAAAAGFQSEFLPGFYDTNYKSFYKNFVSNILNLILSKTPFFTKEISPFLAMRFWTESEVHSNL